MWIDWMKLKEYVLIIALINNAIIIEQQDKYLLVTLFCHTQIHFKCC